LQEAALRLLRSSSSSSGSWHTKLAGGTGQCGQRQPGGWVSCCSGSSRTGRGSAGRAAAALLVGSCCSCAACGSVAGVQAMVCN
jgi:hypothetical protein